MNESAELLKRLKRDGWVKVSQQGSHVTLKKEGERNLITVPHPRKQLSKGLRRAIERAAGWK